MPTQETQLTPHLAKIRACELQRQGCIIYDIVPQQRPFGLLWWTIIYARPKRRS